MAKMTVQDTSITVLSIDNKDYISLTDIAKYKTDDPNAAIGNWMRNRNTIEYLGIWEALYNPNFKPLEFEGVRTKPIEFDRVRIKGVEFDPLGKCERRMLK